MGSPDTEEGRSSDEAKHTVKLSPFLIAKYEVTQAEYEAVMAGNTAGLNPTPSVNYGNAPLDPQRPVEEVSWNDLKDADGFLARTGLSLPSEAQWEYACRAGTPTPYSVGATITPRQANHEKNVVGKPTPVGTYPANAWGFHDLHGNVWEWCGDWWSISWHKRDVEETRFNPKGPDSSKAKVIRGGSFLCHESYCDRYRVAARTKSSVSYTHLTLPTILLV